MGWINCVRCEKFRCDFAVITFALIAAVQPVLQRVLYSNETLPNAPKHYETHQNMNFGPMGWIGSVHCKKFWCDFMARTCALIPPVQPILHRVSCSSKILPNTHKQYGMHTNMSLGSNGVGRVHSLRIIPKWLHSKNLCINCASSTRFAPIFV